MEGGRKGGKEVSCGGREMRGIVAEGGEKKKEGGTEGEGHRNGKRERRSRCIGTE